MIAMIILIMLIPYLVVGARFARNAYALDYHRWKSNPVALTAEENIKMLRAERDNLLHESYCNLNYSHLRVRGCDCNCKSKWRELARKIDTGNVVLKAEPGTPIKELVGWPIVMFGNYLTGGTVKKPNYNIIQELERDNGIAELE